MSILEHFNWPSPWYSLVPDDKTKYVTIRHQQERAVKLAERLKNDGEGKTFWVIGAGAAGLTFAATMCRYGRDVAVLERLETSIWNLRGGFTRWLDPYIFSWPDEGWKRKCTALPAYNWTGSYAHHVNSQLAWGTPADLPIYLNVTVDLKKGYWPWKLSRQVVHKGNPFDSLNPCQNQVVIIATGHGLEQVDSCAHNTSYWLDDDLERQDPYQEHRQIVIVGNGDGAITDLVRARIGLTHREILENVANNEQLRKEMDTLVERFAGKPNSDTKLNELKRLAQRYTLDLPLRSRTNVTLIARHPLSNRAFPINHFLVAYLLTHDAGGTRFVRGHGKSSNVSPPKPDSPGHVFVEVRQKRDSDKILSYEVGDVLVYRVGTEGKITWAEQPFDQKDATRKNNENDKCDESAKKNKHVRIELSEPLGRTVNLSFDDPNDSSCFKSSDPRALADIVVAKDKISLPYKGVAPIGVVLGARGARATVFSYGVEMGEWPTKEAQEPVLVVEAYSLHQHRHGQRRPMGIFRFAIIKDLPDFCSSAANPLKEALMYGVEVVLVTDTVVQAVYKKWQQQGLRFECVDLNAKTPLELEHGHRIRVWQKDDLSRWTTPHEEWLGPIFEAKIEVPDRMKNRYGDEFNLAELHQPLRIFEEEWDKSNVEQTRRLARVLELNNGIRERNVLERLKAELKLLEKNEAKCPDHSQRKTTNGSCEDSYIELRKQLTKALHVSAVPAVERRLGSARLFKIGGGVRVEESIDWALCHRGAIHAAIEEAREQVYAACREPAKLLNELFHMHAPHSDQVPADDMSSLCKILQCILGPPGTSELKPSAAQWVKVTRKSWSLAYRNRIYANDWSTELLWTDIWAQLCKPRDTHGMGSVTPCSSRSDGT